MMPVFDYDTLDPGIRSIVRHLHRAGFETTDSGDGISKPKECYDSGEAMPFKHVAVSTLLLDLQSDAMRLQRSLDAVEPDTWTVEATFFARSGVCSMLARELDASER